MAKETRKSKRPAIELLRGELYAHSEYDNPKWFGIALRPTGGISGEYQFWTEDGYKTGESQFCTRIWEKSLLDQYEKLKNEAQGK